MINKIACKNCGFENNINSRYCSQCGYELPGFTREINDSKVIVVPKKRKFSRSQIIGSVVGTAAAAIAYIAIQQIFIKAQSFDKELMTAASEINKTCPVMVDQYTRLDNTVALPNKTFQYNYTIIGIDKNEVIIDSLKKYIDPLIINNVKTNPDLEIYREHKVTMVYYYKDEKGEFVYKISVTPDMYK